MSQYNSENSLTTSLPPFDSKMAMKKEIPWDICALPTNWEPDTRPSKVVDRLLSEKKQQHETCLDHLGDELAQINKDSEDAIRSISTTVRNFILETQQHVEDLITAHTYDFTKCEAHMNNYKEVYKILQQQVDCRCHCALVKIQALDNDLKRLETERMASFKGAMKVARQQLDHICYKLPNELQTYFETEMMQLNQITLSNYHVYNELHMELMSRILSNERAWHKRIDELKDVYKIKHAEYLAGKPTVVELIVEEDDELTLGKVRVFAEELAIHLFHTNGEFVGALNALHLILDKISKGSYEEVQNLQPDFAGVPKRQYLSIYNEIYNSLFDEGMFEVITLNTAKMMQRWQDVVEFIDHEVNVCKRVTVSGLHIWDKHFERCFGLKEVFAMDLWDMVNKASHSEDALLNELHRCADKLRTSPEEPLLKVAMGECKKIMDSINKSIQKNYDKQMKYFNKFRELMIEEGEILYLEMFYFLKCQPSGDDVNPTIFHVGVSRFIPEEKPVLMQEFDADIKAIHSWMFGVNQYLSKSAVPYRERSISRAEEWIQQNLVILERQHKLKQGMSKETMQKIFHHIYRVRLAELIGHEKRLNEHVLGVDAELKKLYPMSMSLSDENPEHKRKYTKYTTHITEFQRQVKKLNENLKGAKGTHSTLSVMKQMEAFRNSCIVQMQKIKDESNTANTQRAKELLHTNLNFVKHIHFFSENGNYDPAEFANVKKVFAKSNKDLTKEQALIEKTIETELVAALDEVKEIESQIVSATTELNHQFEFKEFVQNHILDVRAALKQETTLLLQNDNELSAYVSRLEDLAAQNVGQIEYLDNFTTNCEYIEQLFKDLYGKILQTKVFTLDNDLFKLAQPEGGDQGLCEAKTIKDNIKAKLAQNNGDNQDMPSSQNETSGNNFQMLLPSIPDGDDYMAKIVRILFESLKTIQERAQKYYNDMDPTEDGSEKMQTFMVNQMAKYLYFQLQCDEILLQVTINYILELDDLLTFMSEYYRESMRRFVEVKLNDLSKKCAHFKSEMRVRKQSVEQRYQDIHGQLKPLHGHPRNKNMLEELTNQLTSLDDQVLYQQTEMDKLYLKYEAVMESNISHFEDEIDKMEVRLKKAIDRLIVIYIQDERIFEQLLGKLTYFKRILAAGDSIITSAESIDIEIVDLLNSKLNLLKHGLKMSSTAFSQHVQTKWKEISSIQQKYSSDEYLPMSSASSINLPEIIDNFREDQQNCLREIENWKGIEETSELWADIWRNDVARINALYTVRYAPEQEPTL